jgi:hypothetical protein
MKTERILSGIDWGSVKARIFKGVKFHLYNKFKYFLYNSVPIFQRSVLCTAKIKRVDLILSDLASKMIKKINNKMHKMS